MPKLFKVPMMLYIEAHDQTQAEVAAEIASFKATAIIRKTLFLEDKVSMLTRAGNAVVTNKTPEQSYNKQFLIDTIGEDRAISWLNHAVDSIYP